MKRETSGHHQNKMIWPDDLKPETTNKKSVKLCWLFFGRQEISWNAEVHKANLAPTSWCWGPSFSCGKPPKKLGKVWQDGEKKSQGWCIGRYFWLAKGTKILQGLRTSDWNGSMWLEQFGVTFSQNRKYRNKLTCRRIYIKAIAIQRDQLYVALYFFWH